MYTVHKNVQVILALLKKYGIRNIVISAGTRHIPFVFSAEEDKYFNCYSIVDERSAGFFALGLIQSTGEPACIICTSGTATCNYVSAVNEAYYQHLPLVVLTSDRNRYNLNQQEDQCLPQLNLFYDVAKKIVDLPIVRDTNDFNYCVRLVNEALLELDHREKGPVHINFQIDDNYPIEMGTFKFELSELPEVIKVERISPKDDICKWQELVSQMSRKRIVILYGQHLPVKNVVSENIQCFCESYNTVVLCDHLSNLHIKNKIDNPSFFSAIQQKDWEALMPDIVITMNGHRLNNHKLSMQKWSNASHWHVSPEGVVSDPFHRLSRLIECPIEYFFEFLLKFKSDENNAYYHNWCDIVQKRTPNCTLDAHFEYSAVYAVQNFFKLIPDNAILHVANSNSIRIANTFPLPKSVEFYCNRGCCGIDGSMSSYIAQSAISNRPSFMIIGDLSFFYDMNALWNRYTSANTRIMLCNNSGGALFHSGYYKKIKVFDNIDTHIAAEHNTSAKGWAESRGFKYLSAHNAIEFDNNINDFVNTDNKMPVLFEVFTDKEVDVEQMGKIAYSVRSQTQQLINRVAAPLKKILKK